MDATHALTVPEGRWTYPSKSDADKTYTVTLRTDGRISCDCRGWIVLRKTATYRSCSHTDHREGQLGSYTFGTVGQERFVLRTDGFVVVAPDQAAVEEEDARDADAAGADSRPAYYAPMLAFPNEDSKPVDDFGPGWVMEQKFDGHRISIRVAGGVAKAWSRPRAGSTVGNAVTLHPSIAASFADVPDGFYDGELVVPNGSSSDVRALVNDGRQVCVLFDVCEVLGVSVLARTWEKRRELLDEVAGVLPKGGPVTVSATHEPSQAMVEAIWAAGGEGVMLKRRTSTYRAGARSRDWIKIKALAEAVFEVTGFVEGKSGPHSIIELRHVENGKTTTVKTKDAAMFRRIEGGEIGIGTRVEVEYQHETAASFRHPRVKRVEGED